MMQRLERLLERDFAQRLQQWHQQGFPDLGDESGAGLGQQTKKVLLQEGFFGNPKEAAGKVWREGGCKAASNGAVMRTAITGVPYFWDLNKCMNVTVAPCCTTHANPRCIASCAAVATCVALMLQGLDHEADSDKCTELRNGNVEGIIKHALAAATEELECSICSDMGDAEIPSMEELGSCFVEIRELEDLRLRESHAIGYTYKCLKAGLWGLRFDQQGGFLKMVQTLVAAGGDADTNAAVAGALLGCRVGFSRLPKEWISQMPHAA